MMVNMSSVVQRIILSTFGELNTDFLPRGETKTSFMRAFQVRQEIEDKSLTVWNYVSEESTNLNTRDQGHSDELIRIRSNTHSR